MATSDDWNEPKLVYRRGRRPKGLKPVSRRPDRSRFQYRTFPQRIHGRAVLNYSTENAAIQKILIKILKEFNKLRLDTSISVADREGYLDGWIAFEVGIANNNYFSYLDGLEERLVNDIITKQGTLPIVDFMIVARYLVNDRQRHPIRTDSYLLRFIASQEYTMEAYLSHLKGIRRVNPDELIMMIAKELDRQSKASYDMGVKIELLRTA